MMFVLLRRALPLRHLRRRDCAEICRRSLNSSGALAQIVKSRYADVELSTKDYYNYIWENVDHHPKAISLIDGITDDALDYTTSRLQSLNFAVHMHNLGTEKGQVCALLLFNCVEYPLLFAGCSRIGVTLTTLNPIYTPTEIAKQLRMSHAKWAVTSKELLPHLEEAIEKLVEGNVEMKRKWREKILIAGEPVAGYHSANTMLTTRPSDPDPHVTIDVNKDVCVLPYSSGTTGVPKGVMLTHFNMVANVCQGELGPPEIQLVPRTTDSYQSVTVCVLPLFHVFAMNVTMTPTLWAGGKMVVLPKFDPKTFVHAIEKYRPTFLHLPPPLVSFLASSPDVTPDHLASLDHIVVAAAPSGPALIRKFKEKAPKVIYREAWGMSETSPIVHVTPLNDEVNGSCGVLVPNTEAKVVDVNSGEALGPMKRGELCIRGPQNMAGYLENPEATKSTLVEDWLHTGDIAVFDEQGRFYIVDRLKELIKVKGFQVPPAELEDTLRSHPKVQDVAVIGIPHEKFGEAPRAYIVPEDPLDLTDSEIHDFMAENAAAYKQLVGGVEFIEKIPKSAAGKILRKELAAMYSMQFETTSG